jgi:phosphoribosylanthranilate isomerase
VTTDPESAGARTRVKICGITSIDDARRAAGGGAWAIGMIMWKASPRYVRPQAAAQIVDDVGRSVETVGVFVDQPLDEVVSLTNEIGLGLVQLHGDEGQKFCNAVAQRTGARVIKAFRVRDRSVLSEMGKFHDVDYHLLDSYKAGVPGGTGQTFDWTFLRSTPRRARTPLILSGGLGPDNVAAAIESVGPWAVDVSSGVERSPGVKDAAKLAAFFAAVEGARSPRRAGPDGPLTGAEDEVLTLQYARRELEERGGGS